MKKSETRIKKMLSVSLLLKITNKVIKKIKYVIRKLYIGKGVNVFPRNVGKKT